MKKNIAIIGYGNIGKAVLNAVNISSDFNLAGIVRRKSSDDALPELLNVKVADSIDSLGKVDVAVITLPSRLTSDYAKMLLEKGISCVDSYDIHSDIFDVKIELDKVAKKHNAASIISGGWDPGTDSVVRALMQAMAPRGITSTNFGPGMSMGHTVCVKSKDGVKDALSMTMPKGDGLHRRIVYVVLEKGVSFEKVSAAIKSDSYFVNDETIVRQVADIDSIKDMGHGVHITRKGVSGSADNQIFNFDMKINNPALTGQVLVSCARAVLKQRAGCYTMIEIPPVDFLSGSLEENIRTLV